MEFQPSYLEGFDFDDSLFDNLISSPPSDFDQAIAPTPSKDEETRLSSEWTWMENKVFEATLAEFGSNNNDFNGLIENMGKRIPSKNMQQINDHLQALFDDVNMIESGLISVPNYQDHSDDGENVNNMAKRPQGRGKESCITMQRRRGVPWTDKEHRLFLEGLTVYGKGDWKSISRHMVKTKSATQVASHAQKYFLRLQNPSKRGAADMRTVAEPSSDSASEPQTTKAPYLFSSTSARKDQETRYPSINLQ